MYICIVLKVAGTTINKKILTALGDRMPVFEPISGFFILTQLINMSKTNSSTETGLQKIPENKGELSLQHLYTNQEAALMMPRDTAIKFLNVNPPDPWIKTHPYIKGYRYLPIDKVEFLLRVIFKEYEIEIIDYKMILNAVTVHVRVKYKDLTTGEWRHHDGVGALEPQTKGGTGALRLDIENINPGAIAMALPIAKSVAVKDACDHLGNVFGANLNRKDTFSGDMFNTVKDSIEESRLKALIDSAESAPELEKLRAHLTEGSYPNFEAKLNSFTQLTAPQK